MNNDKARVIASWRPHNEREAAAMKEFLLQEMGVSVEHHQGGTGKLAAETNTGRRFR